MPSLFLYKGGIFLAFDFKPITKICLNITEMCQCACPFCFAEYHPHRISYQVAKDAADWIIKNSELTGEVGSIGFFGGEPLLEWDTIIVPLTKYIKDERGLKDFELGVTTNCLLLDEEKLKFMKKYDFGLLCSIDGAKETQDYNRPCRNGQSSFDIIDEKISLILKYFPDTLMRSTIIPATCEHYFKNLEYGWNKGFYHSFTIINQFEEWPEDKRKILEEQVRKFSNYLITCFREGLPFMRQRTLEQAINKIVGTNLHFAQGNVERIKFDDLGRCCGLGSGYGAINYEGDIFTCQEAVSREKDKNIFYIGNIYTGIDKERQQKLFDDVYANGGNVYNSVDKNKCKECPIEASCNMNSCLVNNYLERQLFDIQADAMCWWNNLMAKEAQYICYILGTENNEYFKDYFKWVITSQGGTLSND